ncbi:hypothetical protein K2173_021704 [Erythroxylum novogranatense]|uniref:Uncharacterized protein n=1 Tax=Erythroxylum novogranatense TaxID=1862640 RepID=A0AAV8TH97_9ROSI|nr:hypothetical protein K2173_021704 [Erythroxylum novogranatense]
MKHSSGSSSFIPILSVLFLVLVTTDVAVEARKSSPGEKTNVENLQKPKCSGDEDCFGEAVFNNSLKRKKGNSKIQNMKANLTFRDFSKRGGGEKATCGDKYYRNTKNVVAISSDWLGDDEERCNKQISITGNGVTVTAEVVDECDISDNCIAASRSVGKGLGIRRRKARKESIEVTWSDA